MRCCFGDADIPITETASSYGLKRYINTISDEVRFHLFAASKLRMVSLLQLTALCFMLMATIGGSSSQQDVWQSLVTDLNFLFYLYTPTVSYCNEAYFITESLHTCIIPIQLYSQPLIKNSSLSTVPS